MKLSKRCQISKIQTSGLWRRFTQKINWHNEVHTYSCQFWHKIWRWSKLVKNTFCTHFEGFWWWSYVTSKLTSISVNLIMSIYFLWTSSIVKVLVIFPFFIFLTTWHLLTFISLAYVVWGKVIISHLSVCSQGVLSLAGGTYPGCGVPKDTFQTKTEQQNMSHLAT